MFDELIRRIRRQINHYFAALRRFFWWVLYYLHGPKPNKPRDLRHWINSNPVNAASIRWQYKFHSSAYDIPPSASKDWNDWSEDQQLDLVQAFNDSWHWYYSQADPLQDLQETIPYPPANISGGINNDHGSPYVKVDQSYAWTFYTRWLAQSLFTELANHVPWSILEYNEDERFVLLDSTAMMSVDGGGLYVLGNANPSHQYWTQRKFNRGSSLIAPPRYTYAFLRQNGIIGATRRDTIGNLLQWVSDNLIHFYGGSTYENMEAHWQYRGLPPITRIIEGSARHGEFRHWTAGCHGTLGFLRDVLRAANIPVQGVIICQHAVVYFITEDLYLDHGDNPYNSAFKDTGLHASALLIDSSVYERFVGNNPDNDTDHCDLIGQQINVLTGDDTG